MEEGLIIKGLNAEELFAKVRSIVKQEIANNIETPKKEIEPANTKETYNSREAADYLRISIRTLYNKVKQNKIKHSNDGKLVFTKNQLDNYLMNHEKNKSVS